MFECAFVLSVFVWFFCCFAVLLCVGFVALCLFPFCTFGTCVNVRVCSFCCYVVCFVFACCLLCLFVVFCSLFACLSVCLVFICLFVSPVVLLCCCSIVSLLCVCFFFVPWDVCHFFVIVVLLCVFFCFCSLFEGLNVRVFVFNLFVCFFCCFGVLLFDCFVALCLLPFCTLECVSKYMFAFWFLMLFVFVC